MDFKKNVLLISLDTVRADVAYSGRFEEIEKIRRDGVTFLNTVSSSPLTPVSHATVLTGLQPYHHGIRHLFQEKLKEDAVALAQILRTEGYQTGAVVSCPGMNKWYDFCRGFDHYDDEIPKLTDGSDPLETVDVQKRGTALKRAEQVIEKANEWVDGHRQDPFFLFIHFFDAHWPYEAPEIYGGRNPYEEEVAYSAHYLGLFLDRLKKEGLLERTTLVCFSDHGEDLEGLYQNDKGGGALGHPEELGHGCLLYEQTQKAVLIIVDDLLPRNKNISRQVRLVDIAPTLLKLLNIRFDFSKFDGKSLIPVVLKKQDLNLLGYSETFYPEEMNQTTEGKFPGVENKKAFLISNRYKIITHLESHRVEFYDLTQDPNELNDLA